MKKAECGWKDSNHTGFDHSAAPMDSFNDTFRTVPYLYCNRPPRTLLGFNTSIQSLCHPYVNSGDKFWSVHHSTPVVSTTFGRKLEKAGYILPGEDVIVLYANMGYTHENCILAARDSAERGLFSRWSKCTVPVPISTPKIVAGSWVKHGAHSWWKGPTAKVVNWVYSVDISEHSVTLEFMSSLTDGDKLVTLHGWLHTPIHEVTHPLLPM